MEKEPSSEVKSRVKTASRDKGGYLVDERLKLFYMRDFTSTKVSAA